MHFRSNIFQLMWWKQSRSVFFIVNSKHPDFQVNHFHFFQSHFILKLIYPNVLNILYVCLSGWLHLSKYAPWQIESSKISFRFRFIFIHYILCIWTDFKYTSTCTCFNEKGTINFKIRYHCRSLTSKGALIVSRTECVFWFYMTTICHWTFFSSSKSLQNMERK